MSLLQPKNSLIQPKNHYATNFFYGMPQDHHYSHKLKIPVLFHLLSLQTVSFKIPQKQWLASPLLQSYLTRQEYDTIFICMKNFQDVLQQRHFNYGPLWCDESVYRIAKELQLLNPSLFGNVFLGLGGFHLEKVLISCCGSYLQECGIGSVFVENEVFGPGLAQSVLSGGHYVYDKKGMMMLAETLQQL